MSEGEFRFRTTLRVRWMEADAQGIVYFGSYMDYLEVAQAEYYRNLGFSVYRAAEAGYFDTAVVKVEMEFKAPARVDDVLDVWVRLSRIGNTSLTSLFRLCCESSASPVAEGRLINVAYDASKRASKPVPKDVRRLVQHYEDTGQVLPLADLPDLAAALNKRSEGHWEDRGPDC